MSYNATGNSAGRRIATLLDEGSFVEIGGAVTARSTDFNLQEKETPADGVITGYGVIDGNLVYVYSQDATVLNGAVGEMHANRLCRIETSGSYGCFRSFWKCLLQAGNGIGSCSADCGDFRYVRRRTCSCSGTC